MKRDTVPRDGWRGKPPIAAEGVYSSRMSFDQREWVNEIVTGTITGLVSGAAAATFVPAPPFLDLMASGGLTGLVTGLCVQPVRWLLNRRPGATDPSISAPRDANGPYQGSSSVDAVRPKTEDYSS